ncbi:OmpA family protein [Flavobacterium sp. DGU11]|uniref:OmpA family protein n=1 Tax=Flavobacterium arundinis TaxID=3139143 RepID=A0ABU9I166_9FLAO
MKRLFLLLALYLSIFANAQEKFTVYFDFDIDEANDPSAMSLSEWISEHKDVEVQKIYGYADSIGNALYNIDLSERRAMYVFEKLKEGNIDVANVEEKGLGESEAFSIERAKDRKAVLYFRQKPIIIEKKPEPVVTELAKKITEAVKGDKIAIPRLHFFDNSDLVLPESRPVLYELLAIMKNNPNLRIDIQGHICCQKIETNQISQKRALAVYAFLKNNGIDRMRLSYQSFGSSKPVYPLPEKTEEEKVANRRVEIEIIEN